MSTPGPPTDADPAANDGIPFGEIAGAVSAVIAVIGGLAVAGLFGKAQRNHGDTLLVAFSLILLAAWLWLVAANFRTGDKERKGRLSYPVLKSSGGSSARTWTTHTVRWRWKVFFRVLALCAFAAGLGVAIASVISTQKDSERPSVSALYDPATRMLKATATAQGLSSDGHVAIIVSGEREDRQADGTYTLTPDPKGLFFAVVGPNSTGDVNYNLSVHVPGNYHVVGITASTGFDTKRCVTTEKGKNQKILPQHLQAGCVMLRLP